MDVLVFNAFWMAWNIFLAFVGVAFSWAIFRTRRGWGKLLLLPLWLAFVPNTVYVLTDIIHLPPQLLYVDGVDKFILLLQYFTLLVFGIITFYMSLRLFESGMRRASVMKMLGVDASIAILNFIIAFGVMMGRIERTNSWQVVTNFRRVVEDGLSVATSTRTMTLVLLAGLFYNLLYFTLKKLAHR